MYLDKKGGQKSDKFQKEMSRRYYSLKEIVWESRRFVNLYYKFLKAVLLIKNFVRPEKRARVYVKRGINRRKFFEILNTRGVEYVLLRWWEDFPKMPEGEDMDILIKDEHRDLIEDLITYRDNGTEMKCDIYTITGSKNGSHKGIPYFQNFLAVSLLKTREYYRGTYVPSPVSYFASLAYHAIFHKGVTSGLVGFKQPTLEVEHNYTDILEELSKKQKMDVVISVQGLYDWLKEHQFLPAEDTLSKLVEIKPGLSILQYPLSSDIRGGELMAYVVRQKLVEDNLMEDLIRFLYDEFDFEIIDVCMLNPEERKICASNIRGGKWDKGPYKYSGGPPVAVIVAYDYYPTPLESNERERQTRMTNRNNLLAKYSFREKIASRVFYKGNYNGIHSADNEHDAFFYIGLLGQEYKNRMTERVEQIRNRTCNKRERRRYIGMV